MLPRPRSRVVVGSVPVSAFSAFSACVALVVACGARTELLVPEGQVDVGIDAATKDVQAPVLDGSTADSSPVDTRCLKDTDCNDGIDCTVDTCKLPERACTAKPDDSRCPISQICDATLGCVALAFAVDAHSLYDVRLPSAHYTLIGGTGNASLIDIALHPDNILYGVSNDALFRVDPETGDITQIAPVSVTLNALDAAPDGTLYGSGDGTLYTVDRATGKTTPLMQFPAGTTSSGDLAFVGPRLLASATTAGADDLVELDVEAKTSRVIGSTGFKCLYGLAAYATDLYGFTCNGEVLTIDADTGAATLISKSGIHFFGATAR